MHENILVNTLENAYDFALSDYDEDNVIVKTDFDTIVENNGGVVWSTSNNFVIKTCYIKLHETSYRKYNVSNQVENHPDFKNYSQDWYITIFYLNVLQITEDIIEMDSVKSTKFKMCGKFLMNEYECNSSNNSMPNLQNVENKIIDFIGSLFGMLSSTTNIKNYLKSENNFMLTKNDFELDYTNKLDSYIYIIFNHTMNKTKLSTIENNYSLVV